MGFSMITTQAGANRRLDAIGVRLRWLLTAEQLFTTIQGEPGPGLFVGDRLILTNELDVISDQMTVNGWTRT